MKFLHRERAGIRLLGIRLFAGGERVTAERGARVEPQLRVERAKLAELLFRLPNQAARRILDGHEIHFAFRCGVRAIFHIADDAAQLDALARLIRGPVGVQVPFRREAGAKLQPGEANDIRSHVAIGNRKHAQVAVGF